MTFGTLLFYSASSCILPTIEPPVGANRSYPVGGAGHPELGGPAHQPCGEDTYCYR
jgi:hypothetical protein